MPTIANEVINKVVCQLGKNSGTGSKHCAWREKLIRGGWLSKAGFDYNSITDLTAEQIAVEIQKGNIIPLPTYFNFERQSEDNVRENAQSGESALSRKGLNRYTVSWNGDALLQSVMASLDSNGRYDYVSIDATGNMKLVKDGSKITGANCFFDTNPFMEADGTAASKVSAFIELKYPDDYNNPAYFGRPNLPFNPLKVKGVNDVVLSLTSFAAAATEVTFTATLKDGTTAFTGATDSEFQLLVNGTAADISGISESATTPGTYTITGLTALSASDELVLSTWDSSLSVKPVIMDGVDVYSGTTTEVVA